MGCRECFGSRYTFSVDIVINHAFFVSIVCKTRVSPDRQVCIGFDSSLSGKAYAPLRFFRLSHNVVVTLHEKLIVLQKLRSHSLRFFRLSPVCPILKYTPERRNILQSAWELVFWIDGLTRR